jgi:hypothetical protein
MRLKKGRVLSSRSLFLVLNLDGDQHEVVRFVVLSRLLIASTSY